MTQPNLPDQQAIRREVFAAVNAGIDVGLPVPETVSFSANSPFITLDSAADLCGWADWFGHTAPIAATDGQPHPNLAEPFQSDEWLTNVYFEWRGDTLHLGARDPITDEQRQHWVDSGRAAYFAEPEAAEPPAADDQGYGYSREEDPTPVSPARGGPLHAGGVVDGGELVDETPAEPEQVLFVRQDGTAVDVNELPVHYLEPGAEGDLDDTVACGKRIRDIDGYVTDGAAATCKGCSAALAELDS